MNAVWTESLSQTQQMLKVLVNRSGATTNELIQGIRILVINIISLTGFGAKVPWKKASLDDKPSSGHSLTFIQTLLTIMNRHFVAFLIPTRFLRLAWMPPAVQTIGTAVDEFPRYAAEIIQEQREQNDSSDNLIKTLVSNLQSNKANALTENEIVGNLFNFSIAGFDTTANTTVYAIMSLALDPDLQNWIFEEVAEANTRYPGSEYDECFPMLKRSVALMVSSPNGKGNWSRLM
jgi:cytochrome P450